MTVFRMCHTTILYVAMHGSTACHPSQHSGDGDRKILYQPRIRRDPVSTQNKTACVTDTSDETTTLNKRYVLLKKRN